MIPASIMAKGERVALDYLLESSPLGAFFEREDVRRALAEDIILEQFKPFVFTALFVDDEALLNQWKIQRPDAYALARRLAEGELSSYQALSRENYLKRLNLRLSAYRKIDAWWCGSELFVPTEALGAEPYFTLTLPGHENNPVKIGQTRTTSYNSDPKRDAVAMEMMQDASIVATIERVRFPLLPPETADSPKEWDELQAVLTVADSFRAFDRTSKLPVFPKALIVDPTAIPQGFSARFALSNDLWSSLYALGITPILSQPAVDYLKTKTRSIGALVTDRDTLLNFLSRSIHFQAA